jgi:hypothetical protein
MNSINETANAPSPLVQQILHLVKELSPADQKLLYTILDAIVKQRRNEKHNQR